MIIATENIFCIVFKNTRRQLMKINEIIREKRKEQALTQEQVAQYLGISTPAVNKWEKGNTV